MYAGRRIVRKNLGSLPPSGSRAALAYIAPLGTHRAIVRSALRRRSFSMTAFSSQAVQIDPLSNGMSSLDALASSAVPPVKPVSFYQRSLPPTCTSFTSAEGKRIFADALADGTMDCFFPLSSQFLSQNEVAYCGLGALTMILNALGVDPQKTWKGPWRWYSQDMLDCCRPISAIAKEGLTFAEFNCLARCNGLSVTTYSPPSSSPTPLQREEGIGRLREDLQRATRSSTEFMALSYSRRVLGQTGDGHFSPIGGYDAKSDKALILDVARFKYPSHWVSVPLLWDSLVPVDKATSKSRGYSLLSALPRSRRMSDSITKTTLTLHKASWADLARSLTSAVLLLPRTASSSRDVVQAVWKVIDARPTMPVAVRPGQGVDFTVDAPSRAALSELTPDPLASLFISALFSEKDGGGALASVMDPTMRKDVANLMSRVVSGLSAEWREEVEAMRRQIQALGECCASEGKACGCASAAGKR